MAENSYNPTAANILASLKIRGASVTGGNGRNGYVPVLNSEGKLDASVISIDAISSLVNVPPLPDVAYVDINASQSAAETGSVAAPFRTIEGAANAGYQNFLLTGGNFGSVTLIIPNTLDKPRVRIFSLGSSIFTDLTLGGYAAGTIFEFYNVSVASRLSFSSNISCTAMLFGNSTIIGHVLASDSDSSVRLFVAPTIEISSVDSENVELVNLATSDRIANASENVDGDTVTDAIDSLAVRKIRIPVFSGDASGLHADTFLDVPNTASLNVYDVRSFGAELVAAINAVFHKNNDSPTYNGVTATKVSAGTVVAPAAVVQQLKFGEESNIKAIASVDENGFLVIA